nr:uncharacterized protein LOC115260647 [Aedes albopictus]
MRIKHPIPSFLTIVNAVCFVEHPNQTRTCRRCCQPVHPKQKCADITVSENNNTNTMTSAAEAANTEIMANEQTFSKDDFPLLQIEQQPTKATPATFIVASIAPTVAAAQAEVIHNDNTIEIDDDEDDDTAAAAAGDDDGDGSSSPYEANEGTNKRRLSSKRGKDKKICASVGSQSGCDSVVSHSYMKT